MAGLLLSRRVSQFRKPLYRRFALTRHSYGYTGNNPVNFVDPSGLRWRPTVDEVYEENPCQGGRLRPSSWEAERMLAAIKNYGNQLADAAIMAGAAVAAVELGGPALIYAGVRMALASPRLATVGTGMASMGSALWGLGGGTPLFRLVGSAEQSAIKAAGNRHSLGPGNEGKYFSLKVKDAISNKKMFEKWQGESQCLTGTKARGSLSKLDLDFIEPAGEGPSVYVRGKQPSGRVWTFWP